jgi:S1-C subfamily serine protease
VLDVDSGSYASNLGFRRGDVIAEVNGQKIHKTRELERIASVPSQRWRLTIVRSGQKISAVFGG